MEDFGRYITEQVMRTDGSFTFTITSTEYPSRAGDGSMLRGVFISCYDGCNRQWGATIRTHLPNGYQLGAADWLVNVKHMIQQMDESREKYKNCGGSHAFHRELCHQILNIEQTSPTEIQPETMAALIGCRVGACKNSCVS